MNTLYSQSYFFLFIKRINFGEGKYYTYKMCFRLKENICLTNIIINLIVQTYNIYII